MMNLFKIKTTLKSFLSHDDTNSPMGEVDSSAVIGTGVKMQESTEIEKEVRVGNDCVFGNKVIIEKKVIIGSNVTIDDDTVIGKKVNVGNNCVLGKKISIEKKTIVGSGVKIGDNVKIGQNATVLDDSTVPSDTVIKAEQTFP